MNKTKEKLNKIEKNLIKISFSPSKYPPLNITGCKPATYAIFYYFVKILATTRLSAQSTLSTENKMI